MYKRNNQGWLKHIDFILWDAVALQLAFIAAYVIRNGRALPYTSESYQALGILLFVVDILIAAVFNTMHNVMKRSLYQDFAQSVKQAALVLAVTALFMFSTQIGDSYSRATVFLTAGFHLVLGFVIRQIWKSIILSAGGSRKKSQMILVADEAQVEEILAHVRPTDEFEYCGIVLTNREAVGEEFNGIPVVADLKDAGVFICQEWVDEVFVYPLHLSEIDIRKTLAYANTDTLMDDGYALLTQEDNEQYPYEEPAEGTVAALIDQCRQMSVPVHIRLPLSNMGGKSFIEKVGGYNVLTTAANYASPLQLLMKRLLDVVGGLAGSVVALLIMLIVGPMIKKESPGPILFKQTRVGKNGKKFQIYKLRSMYLDAEERKKELLKENRISDGMMFKLDWDPRIIGNKIVNGKQVTGIGDFIRRYSLDEFPQFFNVLLNQMSLVGTRPPTLDEWEKYKYHHRARLATKPGITGMWQVSGRSEITDFEEVVRLDTEYINRWSLGLDIRILLKTVQVVLKRDGAM